MNFWSWVEESGVMKSGREGGETLLFVFLDDPSEAGDASSRLTRSKLLHKAYGLARVARTLTLHAMDTLALDLVCLTALQHSPLWCDTDDNGCPSTSISTLVQEHVGRHFGIPRYS